MEYRDQELNYFRLCKIVTSVIPEGLREIFKQQWDLHYTSTHGAWTDTPANYASFYGLESRRNRTKNKRLLGIMTNGDRKNWDSTCLSYAILFSDSIGPRLRPNVKRSVDALRESRNEVAHNSKGHLVNADFQTSVLKIWNAFKTLNLDTTKLFELRCQKTFPTRELNIIKKELKEEKKRNTVPKPFCILPPKPFHDQIERKHEVQDISKKMKELSTRKKGEATTLYLSGNPGCGKSVLAGQIGDEYFDSADTVQPAFVMTINAMNMDTMLKSYIEFAVRVNCYPDSITEITASKNLSQEKQIQQLKALVGKQVEKYASWLMIIDNVINLKTYSKYWPQYGEKMSGMGQILITTQDEHSIPDNCYAQHISLKRGLPKQDVIEVLSTVSGVKGDDHIMFKVAQALDHQPLALACAGVYMKKAKASITWQQYLEKLDQEGKREATEKVYEESSPSYPMSMTVAVRMALERERRGSKVMLHAFEFLSSIASDPVPTENVLQYVMKCLPEEDEQIVKSTITSSSLVMTSGDGDEILTHQIVYNCLQEHGQVETENVDMFIVIDTFSYLLQFFSKNTIKDIVKTRSLLNHFEHLSTILPSYIVLHQPKCQNYLKVHGEILINNLNTIGNICNIHGKYQIAKVFFQLSLSMQLPFFIKEMENIFVESDVMSLNFNQESLDLILKKARSVYQGKNVHCDYSDLTTSLICSQQSYDDFGKRNLTETLSSLGITFSTLEEFSAARDCHKAALEICELEYGSNYAWLKLKAEILNNLAEVSKGLKATKDAQKYRKDAIVLYKEIKRILDSTSESECLYKGLDLNGLVYLKASSYYGLGKSIYSSAFHSAKKYNTEYLEKAIQHFEKALSRYRSLYHDTKHPKVANTLNKLGRCAFVLEKYDQAKSYHEEALSIYKCVYDENHPMMGSTLNNLGKSLLALEYHEEAVTCFNKSLKIIECFRGDGHPTVGELQFNLAKSLKMQWLFSEARIFYKKALATFKRVYGETHPMVVRILLDLAEVLYQLPVPEYLEARMCYESSLAIGDTKDYPYITECLLVLGDACYRQKVYSEARRCYEDVMATGYQRSYIGPLLFNIGDFLFEEEQLIDAHQCYMNSLKTGYGTNITSVGQSFVKLGKAFHKQGHLNEAKACYDTATEHGENLLGAASLFDLGETFCDLKQYQEAKMCFESVLKVYRALTGKEDDFICLTLVKLLITLKHLGCYEAAVPYYKELVDIVENVYGSDNPLVADLYILLGETIEKVGKIDEAQRYFKEGKRLLSLFGRVRRILSSPNEQYLTEIKKGVMMLQTLRKIAK